MKICGGKVFCSDHKMHLKDLCFSNGVISKTSESGEFDATDCYVIPGLIDTHIHGAYGVEFWKSEDDMTPALDWLAENGVTGIMPSLACEYPDELKADIEKIVKLDDSRVVGIHSEGPFINPERKGGMDGNRILSSDTAFLEDMYRSSNGLLKIMTIAPEVNNSDSVVRKCVELGIKVSMGHSNATYEETKKIVDNGASRLTHTFNAMRGYNHRETGILGCALEDDRVNCELICDLYHVSAPAIKLVVKLKGCDNVTMISDSSMFCGLGDGEYSVSGRTIYVENGLCRLKDGTIAGSSRSLFDGARNMYNLGFPVEKIALMASVNPAKATDCPDRGELIEGYRADILVVDRNFNLKAVFLQGERVR